MISEKRKQNWKNMVCIRQFRKALFEKIKLREIEMTEKTLDVYCADLEFIFKQMGLRHDQIPTLDQCLKWKEDCMKRYSRKSMAKRIPILNYYLHYVLDYPEKPIPQIKNISRAKKPTVLTKQQIMDMVDFAESKGKYTDSILIYTGFVTASRKSALLNLKLSDIDFKNNVITLRNCKGDLDLNVPMAKSDMEKIKDYIDNHRPKPHKNDSEYLFIGKNGKKVGDSKLLRTLRYCALHCDIGDRVYPHALRHSRIKDLRKQGYSWEEIMTITGHRDITSLSSYLHEEDFDIVQQKLNNDNNNIAQPQSKKSNIEKELEILKLKLELAEKEKDNLRIQLGLTQHNVKPIVMNADQQTGYV
jgi:site-specific recombinase XerD